MKPWAWACLAAASTRSGSAAEPASDVLKRAPLTGVGWLLAWTPRARTYQTDNHVQERQRPEPESRTIMNMGPIFMIDRLLSPRVERLGRTHPSRSEK